jgi:hypothetical protein
MSAADASSSDSPREQTSVRVRPSGGLPAPLRSVQREAGRQKRGLAAMHANHAWQRKKGLRGGDHVVSSD